MQITTIHEQRALSERRMGEPGAAARASAGGLAAGSPFAASPAGRRYALEGDARPGDVLALAGGRLMRDRNENGLIDGPDALLGAHVTDRPIGPDAPLGAHVAGRPIGPDGRSGVDALVRGTGRFRGGLVDVRG